MLLCASVLSLVSTAQAGAPHFSWERSLSLEKEQLYKARFVVGEVAKDFQFRWTLYKNKGLVLHIRYDKFNHQELLYTDYQRDSFTLPLGRAKEQYSDDPKLLLYFKDFKEKKADFKLYIEGRGASVESDEIEPPKSKRSIADIDKALGKGAPESADSTDSKNLQTPQQDSAESNPESSQDSTPSNPNQDSQNGGAQ